MRWLVLVSVMVAGFLVTSLGLANVCSYTTSESVIWKQDGYNGVRVFDLSVCACKNGVLTVGKFTMEALPWGYDSATVSISNGENEIGTLVFPRVENGDLVEPTVLDLDVNAPAAAMVLKIIENKLKLVSMKIEYECVNE